MCGTLVAPTSSRIIMWGPHNEFIDDILQNYHNTQHAHDQERRLPLSRPPSPHGQPHHALLFAPGRPSLTPAAAA